MKRLFIIFLFLVGCSKPDESILEPTPDLVCVDCIDQISHIYFKGYFCGTDQEADRFITEVKDAALGKGMILQCFKYDSK